MTGYAERQANFWLLKDNAAAQTYQALERAFPKQQVRVTSASDDGRQVVLFVESDVNPGDYYLFDSVTKHADFLRAGRVWDRAQADAAERANLAAGPRRYGVAGLCHPRHRRRPP